MKLYADLPGRRSLQLASDVGIVLWTGLWAYAGRQVHEATLALAQPGRQLEAAGSGFRTRMVEAGNAVDNLPILEHRVAAPFRSASGVGTDIESAGSSLVAAVEHLALLLGWLTALVPIVLVGLGWLALRGRFVRRATAAQHFIDSQADLDLFALRAMARQPMRKLAAISEDPGGAWRRGDSAVIRSLALLELRDSGLRPPALTGGAA
ncbi:MAG: hypothetical protein ABI131_00635 [Nostocoides sp.]